MRFQYLQSCDSQLNFFTQDHFPLFLTLFCSSCHISLSGVKWLAQYLDLELGIFIPYAAYDKSQKQAYRARTRLVNGPVCEVALTKLMAQYQQNQVPVEKEKLAVTVYLLVGPFYCLSCSFFILLVAFHSSALTLRCQFCLVQMLGYYHDALADPSIDFQSKIRHGFAFKKFLDLWKKR